MIFMSIFNLGRSQRKKFYKCINDVISNLLRQYNMIRMLYVLSLYLFTTFFFLLSVESLKIYEFFSYRIEFFIINLFFVSAS